MCITSFSSSFNQVMNFNYILNFIFFQKQNKCYANLTIIKLGLRYGDMPLSKQGHVWRPPIEGLSVTGSCLDRGLSKQFNSLLSRNRTDYIIIINLYEKMGENECILLPLKASTLKQKSTNYAYEKSFAHYIIIMLRNKKLGQEVNSGGICLTFE